jgi:hypothetical protein
MMSNFWPKGIEIKSRQSPIQILETAQKDWVKNSDGELTLLLQEAKSESGNNIIIVHAKHVPTNRIIQLFSVIYRPTSPYPATIEPKQDDLPDFLKKSYYQPSKAGLATRQARIAEMDRGSLGRIKGPMEVEGKEVKNTWVSEEPSEFREKLEQVFNLGIVKSDIMNLLLASQEVANK